MGKKSKTYTFRNAFIDLENNEIIEVTKEGEKAYVLSDALNEFKDVQVTLTIKEESDIIVRDGNAHE